MADTIESQHPQYAAALGPWSRGRDLFAGPDAMKANSSESVAAYLPRPQGMSAEDFAFYKARAVYFNALKRTVYALGGAIFRRPMRVVAPEEIEEQCEDVTLRDEPIESVARSVVAEVLTVGRAVLLLDMPPAGGRPYWVQLRAEAVGNWKTEKTDQDPERLVLAVVSEVVADPSSRYEHKAVKQYRELALVDGVYQARVWTREKVGGAWIPGEWIVPLRRGVPLDFIPMTFVSPSGITSDVQSPPLDDLCHVSIAHYRNSADHEHGLFYTALPTPWAAGVAQDASLRIGPGVCWNLDKDGRAGMLEFSGAGLAAIRDAMSAKERLMAALGARLLEAGQGSAEETATAVRIRHSGDAAALDSIAAATQAALTRMLRWHAWWAGLDDVEDVQVVLPAEFFQPKASPEEIRTALLAVQAEQMSYETFYALLESGGWARQGVTVEAERQAIERGGGEPVEPDEPADPLDEHSNVGGEGEPANGDGSPESE